MAKVWGNSVREIVLRLNLLAALLLIPALTSPALGQQSARTLASMEFHLVGVSLQVGPEYQAVPKGIASEVTTGFVSAGQSLPDAVLAMLPKDFKVIGELTGPNYTVPLTLATTPGSPFELPTLPILGKYNLSNIRLTDGSGKALFSAIPQVVTIESISDPIVTSVTTRPLTLDELRDRGVTFDSTNFTAYEFTGALGVTSSQQPIAFPVLIPNTMKDNPEELPPATAVGLELPAVENLPQLPDNFSLTGFLMQPQMPEGTAGTLSLPPIPGIIMIPNNIAFLHQYFSALLMVTNGAPAASGLIVRNLNATISLPAGDDQNPGTDASPGDDPLRMASNDAGFFPRTMAVLNAGPDGKSGTADDVSLLNAGESGQADATIEGLKEGTHKIDFDISATLEGLPIGPIAVKGRASGAVLVRNPDFTITLGHPAAIRSGEAYDLFVTITNTSKAIANLVSTHLDGRAFSGAVLAPGEECDKQIEMILPGSAATLKYHLISQRTGQVTATAFQSDDAGLKGRFILRLGVGESGIPLSPDSLIIPYTGSLPPDLIDAAVGLLGQAWSVATAPAGALPADVLYIGKQTVTQRANDLSEAGLRLLIGEALVDAAADLAFDFIGSDNANNSFDNLRRRSTQGLNLNRGLAAVFQPAAAGGVFAFQEELARKESYRPGHISVITGESPVRIRIVDASGNRVGGLASGESLREIAYGDQLILTEGATGAGAWTGSSLSLLTKLDSASYRLDLRAEVDCVFDLGIVIPDSAGSLRQVKFSQVPVFAGTIGAVVLLPGTDTAYVLSLDDNGDGVIDRTASSSAVIIDPPAAKAVAAAQLVPGFGPGGDKHGRNIAVLFNRRVTKISAQEIANYAVEENAVMVSYIQQSGRMAFLQLRDGIGPFFGANDPATGHFLGRAVTVSGLVDQSGSAASATNTLPIRITAEAPAAVVSGVVRSAQGAPMPGATVRLLQRIWKEVYYSLEPVYVIFSEKQANPDGSYQFDYVLQNDDPQGPFRIEALNLQTNEAGQVTASVAYHGQQMNLDVFMKARGSLSGTVRDAAGNPVANATVQVETLCDARAYATVTDGSGVFSFAGLRVGAYSLKAVSTTLLAEGATMGSLSDDGNAVVQDITIYPALPQGSVTGKVTDLDDTPRPGMIVIITGERYQNWMRTAANGGYAFTNVSVGPVSVEARDDAVGEKSVVSGTVAEDETTALNIILKGFGSVVCRVTREDGLSPQGFTVIATVNNVSRVALTDASGTASFDHVPVGEVALRVPDPRKTGVNFSQGALTLFAAGEASEITLVIPTLAFSTSSITGTVYQRDGSVWPQAQVMRVLNMDEGTYKPYRADENGKYTIPDPDNPDDVLPLGTYQLVVWHGSEIANGTTTLWVNGQVKTLDLHAVGMGKVGGTIYDPGQSLTPAGADLVLYSMKPNRMGWLRFSPDSPTASIKSDASTGKYAFTGVYAGPVTVSASNIFRPLPVTKSDALATDGDTVTLDLTLQDSFASLYGQVLLPNSTPVSSGVKVTVRYGGADVTVTTDAEGRFAFQHVIPAGNYRVLIEDPVTTLKGAALMTLPAGQDVSSEIRLQGRGSITVSVVTQTGDAVPGAMVKVNGTEYPQDSAAGTTGADGSITFSNLSEGTYAVSVMAGNNIGGSAQAVIPQDNASVAVTVTLAASGSVKGLFYKPDGTTPIAGGQIALMNPLRQVIGYASSSSDPAEPGAFLLESVPLGDFTLEGYDPVTDRKGTGGGRISENGQTVVADVAVTPQGIVAGTVLNYSGTAPIDDATVNILVTGAGSWSYGAVSAPDGSFVFAGVPAGRFSINVADPVTGLAGSASGAITYEGEIVRPEIRLQPSGAIEGRVLLPDGATPVANATVSCVDVTTGATHADVQTDGQGGYRFASLATGHAYRLQAAESGTHRAVKATIGLNYEGQRVEADMTLLGVGYVQGTLSDSDGVTPLAGAPVLLQASGAGGVTAHYTVYTDNGGSFAFSDVPVGTFVVQGSYPGKETGASGSGTLESEGQTVTLNLILGPVGSITGTVLMANGVTSAAGGIVRYMGCAKTYGTLIGPGGAFLLERIPLCSSFTLYLEDASVSGIGYAYGSLVHNGDIVDFGTLVLDDRAIAVSSVLPGAGTVNVPIDATVTVAFSEPADPATVSSSSLYLMSNGNRVSGSLTLSADRTTAIFTPAAPLAGFALYQVVVTTDVRDRVGRALPQIFLSTFTTVDVNPPSVTVVSPADGAVEVATDGVVRITFSESIDPAFTEGIRLLAGDTPVPARLDLVQGNTVAVLTPLALLDANATYTVSMSGVRDSVGNVIAASAAVHFNTLDTLAPAITTLTIPANADLIVGAAVPVTVVTADGDVAFVDFFVDGALAMTDSAAPFTQNILLTREGPLTVRAVAQDKVGNRNTDETHAKEITLTIQPDMPPAAAILAPADGDGVIAGATVTVQVQGTDDLEIRELTLSASGEAVFTQTRSGLTGKNAGASFAVPVPATALSGNLILLTASAGDSAGQSSQAAISLKVIADQPPLVSILAPAEGSRVNPGETLSVLIQATDDLALAELSLTATGESTFSQTIAPVSGMNYTAGFTIPVPSGAVAGNTIQLAAVARDSGGHAGQALRTILIHDDIPPTVSITSPGQATRYRPGETGEAAIAAADNLGVASITCTASGAATGSQTFTTDPGQKQIAETFGFQVSVGAAPHAQLTVICTAQDGAGNHCAASLVLTIADTVAPLVTGATIQNNSATAPIDAPISVSFNETLAEATVNANSVILLVDDGSNEVLAGSVTLSADRKTVTFTPAALLVKGTKYKLILTGNLTDDAGNALGADYVLQFTTSYGVLVIENQGTASAPFMISPGGYNDISILNSHVKTAGPVSVEIMTVTNSTFVAQGSVTAGEISLTNQATLTHDAATLLATSCLEVQAPFLNIDATSKIDVTGKGYLGGWQGENAGNTGMTRAPATGLPTTTGGSGVQNGGSYGGLGGIYSTAASNAAYGDLIHPDAPGSGGGGNTFQNPGGNGGGLVRITAGILNLDGSIAADGAKGYGTYHGGGGSGGGILIRVGALAGFGTISAKGGAGSPYYAAGGGGGRIAIHYDTFSLPVANITTWGGRGHGNGGTAAYNGGSGTVYLKSNAQDHGDLILSNGGIATEGVTPVPGGAYVHLEIGDGAKASLIGDLVTDEEPVISGSQLILSGGITVPGNLTLTGSSLTVSGVVSVPGDLALQNGSVLSHAGANAGVLYRLDLQATAVIVDATSRIDATGKGCLGGWQGSNAGNAGMRRDPDTGLPTAVGGSGVQNGGSHGGLGGIYSTDAVNGTYGDLTNPDDPGSGGGGNTFQNPGGNGGGLVRIMAGSLILDGSIVVDGAKGYGTYHGGGGSGGGILVNVGSMAGSGTISAQGGAGSPYYAAGGGGGRIAIHYDSLTLPVANITARGGRGAGGGGTAAYNGGAGTVYLRDRTKVHGDLILDNGGMATAGFTPMPGGAYSSLEAREGARVSVAGDLETDKDLTLSVSEMTLSGGISVPGNLTLTGSALTVSGAMKVPGSISMLAGSVLSHAGATVAARYGLDLQAGSVTVDAGSRIDVTGKGYLGGWQSGNAGNGGMTRDPATGLPTAAGGSGMQNGGSHGGPGGRYSAEAVNAPYGDPADPGDPGSGGGGNTFQNQGGNGGGLVRIAAGSLTLDGSIVADGARGQGAYHGGGGSGGGILVDADTLAGSGAISARGGAGSPSYAGGGGGGRIALRYGVMTLPQANVTAAGGAGSHGGCNGSEGTVVLQSR
jgi:hypothetical protein